MSNNTVFHTGYNTNEMVRIFHIDTLKTMPFFVKLLGHSLCEKGFVINIENRDISVIVYCEKGKGMILSSYGDTKIAPGDIFIIPASKQHHYKTGITSFQPL